MPLEPWGDIPEGGVGGIGRRPGHSGTSFWLGLSDSCGQLLGFMLQQCWVNGGNRRGAGEVCLAWCRWEGWRRGKEVTRKHLSAGGWVSRSDGKHIFPGLSRDAAPGSGAGLRASLLTSPSSALRYTWRP